MNGPLRLGIAGVGTVGAGVIQMLERSSAAMAQWQIPEIRISAVCARDRAKKRDVDISAFEWFDDPIELAKDDKIDVFVELIGGEDGAAKEAVETALKCGKHVVTANKALLAHHAVELASIAEEKNVALNFEAAIAGGIPIVKTMRESLLGNRITRVYGILNGTCNYILTRMQAEEREFADVLREAQEAGYAEADPAFDIGGHDTAHKLALLTTLAFGTVTSFDSIYLEGIERISSADIEAADELGYRIKLLGVALATESGIEQRVHPTMVEKHSAIAEVDGVTNCVAVDGDFVGDVMLVGMGAGAGPTASSVISDIVDIARGIILPPLIRPVAALLPIKRARMRAHAGGYYIRLSVADRPGSFAAIAGRMAEQNISLKSIVQRPPAGEISRRPGNRPTDKPMPVVMITHDTTEAAIQKAFALIEQDGHVQEPPQMIRIEKL